MSDVVNLANEAADPVRKIRNFCADRGAIGINGIARLFKIMDKNADSKIHLHEFMGSLKTFGLVMTDKQCKTTFDKIDKNNDGKISYDEFLEALQPPMNERRMSLVKQAFRAMDVNNSGEITIQDLESYYNVDKDVLNRNNDGWCTENECWLVFVRAFLPHKNGRQVEEYGKIKITEEDFIDYYRGVSADIDSDDYFESMMNTVWNLFREERQKQRWN